MNFTDNDSSNGAYFIRKEGIAIADSAGANVVAVNSAVIDSKIFDVGNKLITVAYEVTETSSGNGAVDVVLQGSLDGVTFADLATLDLNANTTTLGTTLGFLDATGKQAPYYRFQVKTGGGDTLDASAGYLSFAVKHPIG